MKLDLSPLENAVAQLGESLVLYDSDIVRQFPIIRNQMRAGAIQAFEFTYELSIRMIKRYLEQVSANPSEVDLLDFRNLDAVPRQSRDHQPYLQRAEGREGLSGHPGVPRRGPLSFEAVAGKE